MAFDFSTLTTAQRHSAHRAGRGDGDAQFDADWIQTVLEVLGTSFGTNQFPVQNYVPGGGALTDANIASAIVAAYDAATAAGGNAQIIIPYKSGGWNMGANTLDLYGGGYLNNVWIVGPATLIWPAGFTGECIRLRGSPPSTSPWGMGGLKDLVIECASTPGAGSKAVVLDACVTTTFENVRIHTFETGWYCRDFQGNNYNSQDCTFIGCEATGCSVGFDLGNLSTSRLLNTRASSNSVSDFKIDACLGLSFYGCTVQSTVARNYDFSGAGGSRVLFSDCYSESLSPSGTLFYMPMPSVTSNYFVVKRYWMGGALSIMFDVNAFTQLTVEDVFSLGGPTTILKARSASLPIASPINFSNAGSPLTLPSQFDLDANSSAKATFKDSGTSKFGGHVTVDSMSPTAYAEGSEPASPATGWQVFNSGTLHPRVYNGSAWKDVSYTDDALTLTELLRPYCEEIWDAAAYSKLSIITGNLDAISGVLNGATLNAASSSRRPVFNTSDQFFANRPSFSCTSAGNLCMTGSLNTALQIGSNPGLFCVYRMTGSIPQASPRRIMMVTDGGTRTVFLGAYDSTTPAAVYFNSSADGSIYTPDNNSAGNNLFAHIASGFKVSTQQYLAIDGTNSAAQIGPGTATATMGSVLIGATASGTGNQADVTIAYMAVLKSTPPQSVMTKAAQLAKQLYGVP